MDNLFLAKGAPPEKVKIRGCTPGYPAALYYSEVNRPPIPTSWQKVDDLPSEWVDEFIRNQWTNWIGTGGRFASESVAELARNTQKRPFVERLLHFRRPLYDSCKIRMAYPIFGVGHFHV
jgi:hypothetical protein